MSTEIRELVADLAGIVRVQNGNLYDDINQLLERAESYLGATPHTQPAGCDLDLGKLEELARAATPGPWKAIEWTCHAPTTVRAGAEDITVAETTGHGRHSDVCTIDAAFIAAANPATVLALIAAARAAQAPQGDTRQGAAELAIELVGVRETMAESGGFWSSCSGCHDTEDGHPTGPYSYSSVFGCALGSGCSECGGIGAVWDNTDYEAMSADWDKDDTAAPTAHTCTPADERAKSAVAALPEAWEKLADGFAAQGGAIDIAEAASMRNDAKELREAIAKDTRAAQGAGTAPVEPSADDDMIAEAVKQNNVYGVLPNSASTVSIGRAVLAAERRRVATPPTPVSTAAASMASASIGDDREFRRLLDVCQYESSLGTPKTTEKAEQALIAYLDRRAPSRAADGQQGASHAALPVVAWYADVQYDLNEDKQGDWPADYRTRRTVTLGTERPLTKHDWKPLVDQNPEGA